MAWQPFVSFPAEGQCVPLLVQDMGRRGGSDDGSDQSPEGEEGRTHRESKLLNQAEVEDLRGCRGLFMHEVWPCRTGDLQPPILLFYFLAGTLSSSIANASSRRDGRWGGPIRMEKDKAGS